MRAFFLCTICCVLTVSCGGRQGGSASPFETPAAARARELAPDLYNRGRDAWTLADQARARKNDSAARDHRAAAELWLGAAIAEAERLTLIEQLDELQRREERWAMQLARDQEASAVVATDISRYRARAVALAEAERVAALGESRPPSEETLRAVLSRVRFNLALADALGASDEAIGKLRSRAEALARAPSGPADVAEALVLDSEALIGSVRGQWRSPQPGASTELAQTAWMLGFAADRTRAGVVIHSERFFDAAGQISAATMKRFVGLLDGFPHGPVACQVAVPEDRSAAWTRRVVRLVDRLRRIDDPSRVSTSMVDTDALRAGTVQCTFLAYRGP